jgi:hypothetical protein
VVSQEENLVEAKDEGYMETVPSNVAEENFQIKDSFDLSIVDPVESIIEPTKAPKRSTKRTRKKRKSASPTTTSSTNSNKNNAVISTFSSFSSPLVDYMKYLSSQPQCNGKPLFISMAKVINELYWQLIENFYFTMSKFSHINCAIMICITDPYCMELCNKNQFPCFDYTHPNSSTHVMEQVPETSISSPFLSQ